MKDQDGGFVVAGLCLILPFLLFVTLAGGWSVWFSQSKEQTHFVCQNGLLKAQNHLIIASDRVMALNKIAKGLSVAKSVLRLAKSMIPLPQIQVAVRVALKAIQQAQRLLKKTQDGILKMGDTLAHQESLRIRWALKKQLLKMSKAWSEKSPSIPIVRYKHSPPQVKKINHDTAPQYKYVDEYTTKQTLRLDWRLPLTPGFAQSLRLHTHKKIWRDQCITHPTKTNGQWNASLGKDKSF